MRKITTAELRKQYQKNYYENHKEKARIYQKEYARRKRAADRYKNGRNSNFPEWRGVKKEVFSHSDVMRMSPGRIETLFREGKLIITPLIGVKVERE